LNNPIIANDFPILSSLSNGYKIGIDLATMKKTVEGYDWGHSIFDEPSLQNLAGIVYFGMGDYGHRRIIINSKFQLT
jgi:hypothetical protein